MDAVYIEANPDVRAALQVAEQQREGDKTGTGFVDALRLLLLFQLLLPCPSIVLSRWPDRAMWPTNAGSRQ